MAMIVSSKKKEMSAIASGSSRKLLLSTAGVPFSLEMLPTEIQKLIETLEKGEKPADDLESCHKSLILQIKELTNDAVDLSNQDGKTIQMLKSAKKAIEQLIERKEIQNRGDRAMMGEISKEPVIKFIDLIRLH
jgi:hypothetical protein